MTGEQALKLGNSILNLLAVTSPSTVPQVAAVRGVLLLVNEVLIPEIKALGRKGMISVEEQQKVLDEFNKFNTDFDAQFDKDEWKQD